MCQIMVGNDNYRTKDRVAGSVVPILRTYKHTREPSPFILNNSYMSGAFIIVKRYMNEEEKQKLNAVMMPHFQSLTLIEKATKLTKHQKQSNKTKNNKEISTTISCSTSTTLTPNARLPNTAQITKQKKSSSKDASDIAMKIYEETDDYIALPRYFALALWGKTILTRSLDKLHRLTVKDRLIVPGKPLISQGDDVQVRYIAEFRRMPVDQLKIVQQILFQLQRGTTDGPPAGKLCVSCGAGKTAMGLAIFAYLLTDPSLLPLPKDTLLSTKKAIYFTPLSNLLYQTFTSVCNFMPGTRVGIMAEGKIPDPNHCDLVLALVQTAAKLANTVLDEFMPHFGLTIGDEAHMYITEHYARMYNSCCAENGLYPTATPRAPGKSIFLDYMFGPTVVQTDKPPTPGEFKVVVYNHGTRLLRTRPDGTADTFALTADLTEDMARNDFIAKIILDIVWSGEEHCPLPADWLSLRQRTKYSDVIHYHEPFSAEEKHEYMMKQKAKMMQSVVYKPLPTLNTKRYDWSRFANSKDSSSSLSSSNHSSTMTNVSTASISSTGQRLDASNNQINIHDHCSTTSRQIIPDIAVNQDLSSLHRASDKQTINPSISRIKQEEEDDLDRTIDALLKGELEDESHKDVPAPSMSSTPFNMSFLAPAEDPITKPVPVVKIDRNVSTLGATHHANRLRRIPIVFSKDIHRAICLQHLTAYRLSCLIPGTIVIRTGLQQLSVVYQDSIPVQSLKNMRLMTWEESWPRLDAAFFDQWFIRNPHAGHCYGHTRDPRNATSFKRKFFLPAIKKDKKRVKSTTCATPIHSNNDKDIHPAAAEPLKDKTHTTTPSKRRKSTQDAEQVFFDMIDEMNHEDINEHGHSDNTHNTNDKSKHPLPQSKQRKMANDHDDTPGRFKTSKPSFENNDQAFEHANQVNPKWLFDWVLHKAIQSDYKFTQNITSQSSPDYHKMAYHASNYTQSSEWMWIHSLSWTPVYFPLRWPSQSSFRLEAGKIYVAGDVPEEYVDPSSSKSSKKRKSTPKKCTMVNDAFVDNDPRTPLDVACTLGIYIGEQLNPWYGGSATKAEGEQALNSDIIFATRSYAKTGTDRKEISDTIETDALPRDSEQGDGRGERVLTTKQPTCKTEIVDPYTLFQTNGANHVKFATDRKMDVHFYATYPPDPPNSQATTPNPIPSYTPK